MARSTSSRFEISYVNVVTRDEPADFPAEMKRLVDAFEDKTPMWAVGTAAARPAAGKSGRLYFATDTLVLSYDTGSQWIAIGPTAPTLLVPTGTILEFGGSAPPAGYLMADGTSYLVADYTALHGVIGYQYGGSGLNFNVPNKKGKVGVGRDAAQSEFDTLGESGGAKTHTITEAELAVHDHVIASDGNHFHTSPGTAFLHSANSGNLYKASDVGGATQGFYGWPETMPAGTHSHTGGTGNAGSGSAHNNLQPYLTVNYIIKT